MGPTAISSPGTTPCMRPTATWSSPSGTRTNNVPLLPITVSAFDDSGQSTEAYAVDPARTAQSSGVPTGLSAGTDQTHYVRWTRQVRDEVTGELLATHTYHDIPSSGYGTKDTHYTETTYAYDAQGRAGPRGGTRRDDQP